MLDIACVTTSLHMANEMGRLAEPYRVIVASPGQQSIQCAPGVVLQSRQAMERLTGPLDTLVVSGGLGHARAAENPIIIAHVRRLAQVSRRVASLCTGASILAAAGLLDGRRATTHWRFADELAARYPAVQVDADPIYIRDGKIFTGAGVTSSLDLALALVEEDHGVELARELSRQLVTYLQRPGNQAQMSIFTSAPAPDNEPVRRVVAHVQADLSGDLGISALADVAGISPRHLGRLFLACVGQTPGSFVRRADGHHLVASGENRGAVRDRIVRGASLDVRAAVRHPAVATARPTGAERRQSDYWERRARLRSCPEWLTVGRLFIRRLSQDALQKVEDARRVLAGRD